MEKWQEYIFAIVSFIVFVGFIISIIAILKKYYAQQKEIKELQDKIHDKNQEKQRQTDEQILDMMVRLGVIEEKNKKKEK
jgi:cell division protein FtsL